MALIIGKMEAKSVDVPRWRGLGGGNKRRNPPSYSPPRGRQCAVATYYGNEIRFLLSMLWFINNQFYSPNYPIP